MKTQNFFCFILALKPILIRNFSKVGMKQSQASRIKDTNDQSNKLFFIILQQIEVNNMRVRPLIQQINSESSGVPEKAELPHQPKMMKTNNQKCIVCRKFCHYTCPKCGKHYCGIEHFRSHNLFCSEEFYQKQVTEKLKGLKVKDKEEKKKVVEMVNNFQKELYDMQSCPQLTVQRLQEILKQVQDGKQPKLTKKQQYQFQQYILKMTNMEIDQSKESKQSEIDKGIQVQEPYWEISDGMGIYFTLEPEIQEYGDSEYPEIILERQSFKQRLEQFKLIHPFREFIAKPETYMHLVQLLYAFVTLFRAFDGEYNQFKNVLTEAFCSKQNERLLKMQGISIQILINEIQIQMVKSEEQIYGNNKKENILSVWLNQYYEMVIGDLGKISSNHNLMIETLFRIIDCVQNYGQKQRKDQKDVLNTVNEVNKTRESTKNDPKIKKMVKKCEYLLYLILYSYKQKITQELIKNVTEIKQKRNSEMKEKEIFIKTVIK